MNERIPALVCVAIAAAAFYSARVAAAVHPRVEQALISELRLVYPGAEIGVVGDIRWEVGSLPDRIDQIRLLQDLGNGEVRFQARGTQESEGVIAFQAKKPAWIPLRRIAPGTQLKKEYLRLDRVDVARGLERELRGLILPDSADIESLETRQTLIEGQFVQLTQVQRVHDVKRGDPVQVRVRSGEVTLSTSGTADESGYVDQPIRVLIQKTKRSVAGKLVEKGTVEVNL